MKYYFFLKERWIKIITIKVWEYSKENEAQNFQVVKLSGFPGYTVEFLA